MDPTAVRRYAATLSAVIILILIPREGAGQTPPPLEKGGTTSSQTAMSTASTNTLVALVRARFHDAPPRGRSLGDLLLRLRTALRRPASVVHLPPHEQLIVLGSDGRIARIVDGNHAHVHVDAELDDWLKRPGARMVLIHNHPNGTSLSKDDLGQLAKPGVEAVVAIGHDGSFYAAAAAARYDRDQFEDQLVPTARREIERRIRIERVSAGLDAKTLDLQFTHLVALALHKAKVIQYQFSLADPRRESYERWRVLFGTIAEASAGKVRAELKRIGAQPAHPGAARVPGYGETSWPRVQIGDPITANLVRRVLDEASRLLENARCQTLLTEFRDRQGRALAERLGTLDVDLQTYVSLIVFSDDTGYRPCARGGLALTTPGSRVVHVCGGLYLEESWRRNPRHVVAAYIHEILHTLGLDENPPSSSYITTRVLAQCKGNE